MWAERETGRQSQRYYIGENRQASSWLEHCSVAQSVRPQHDTATIEELFCISRILFVCTADINLAECKSPKWCALCGYSTIGTLSLRFAETSGRPISLNVGMNQTRPLLIYVNPKIYFFVSLILFLIFHSAAFSLENLILIFIPRLELLRMMS